MWVILSPQGDVVWLLGGLSEILCLGHNMSPRSMYATQDEDQPSRRP